MELVSSDKEKGLQTPVWKSYQSILLEAGCSVSLLPPLRTGLGPSTLPWRPGRKEGQAPNSAPWLCERLFTHSGNVAVGPPSGPQLPMFSQDPDLSA